MLIGVILPVLTPSTVTLAPGGNEVTFSEPAPFCARTRPQFRESAMSTQADLINLRIFRSSIFMNLGIYPTMQSGPQPADRLGASKRLIGKPGHSVGNTVCYPDTGSIKRQCHWKVPDTERGENR